MADREATVGSDGAGRASTSRRTFIQLAGSTAGIGLSATASSARAAGSGEKVRLVASHAQDEPARETVSSIREDRSRVEFSLRIEGTSAGMRRFAAGGVDVVAGSRPMLPAELSRAADNDVDHHHRELPTAVAAIRHPASSWVDPLSPTRLAETWEGDGPVDMWAEVTGDVAATETATSGDRDGRTRPSADGTVLVRGVRAYQYARGFGGLGYYEPEEDWLVDRPADDRDSHTPLVRLAFLYADRDSLRRQSVADVVRAFTRLSEERVGHVPYFESPFEGG